MKLVIDIPEALYKMCKDWKEFNISTRLEKIIANGTPYEERPKGEWITHSDYPDRLICSNCNHKYDVWFIDNGTNFCPNCGARMER